MSRIAILVHPTRDVRRALSVLEDWAAERGVEVTQLAGPGQPPEETPDGVKLIVALGGDGTVLGALRAAERCGQPVLGVACGSLGALTTVAADELARALDDFESGEWREHRIPVLAIEPEAGGNASAINDLVFVRAGGSQVTSSVEIDGELYGRWAGDGVVVATQLGSSAYSMAAGGPILAPRTGSWAVTPLSPHGGNVPPVVLGPDTRLRLKVEPGWAGARVEIDGQPTELEPGIFDITLRPDFATLVRLGDDEPHFAGLRRRGIISDSPRVIARDKRPKAKPLPSA
jgi:NAD+ kinase